MTTEAELLRKQIKEAAGANKTAAETQETIAPTAEVTGEPLEIADLMLWVAILVAVTLSLVWFSVWAVVRLLRSLVRGTSAAWHEGASPPK